MGTRTRRAAAATAISTGTIMASLTAGLGGCTAHRAAAAPERASVADVMAEPVGVADDAFVIALGAGDEAGRMAHAHALAAGTYPNGQETRRQVPVLADGPAPLANQSPPEARQQTAGKTVQRSG